MFYKDKDIADLLGISKKSLCNKIYLGAPLPSRIEPPELRVRLWPKKEVHEWLDKYLVK